MMEGVAKQQPRRRLQGTGSGSGSGLAPTKSFVYSTSVPKSAAVCSVTGDCAQDELDFIEKVTKTQIAMQAKYKGSCAGAITAEGEDLSDALETELCTGMSAILGELTVTQSFYEEEVGGDPMDEIKEKFGDCKSVLVPPISDGSKIGPEEKIKFDPEMKFDPRMEKKDPRMFRNLKEEEPLTAECAVIADCMGGKGAPYSPMGPIYNM